MVLLLHQFYLDITSKLDIKPLLTSATMIGCHISSHANCYQTLQSIYAILTYKKKSWKFLGWTSGILLRFFSLFNRLSLFPWSRAEMEGLCRSRSVVIALALELDGCVWKMMVAFGDVYQKSGAHQLSSAPRRVQWQRHFSLRPWHWWIVLWWSSTWNHHPAIAL